MKFRYIYIVLITTILLSGVVMYSCNRKKVDYLGPEYLSAPAGFNATAFSVTPSIDFTAGTCNVLANFSDRVTYTVTFKGLSSGAVKMYTGVDNKLDASTIGGKWNGSHDGLYFFRTGESVEVLVTFLRSDYNLKGTITIIKARDFYTGNPNLIALGGLNNSYENNTNPGNFPSQFSFSNSLPDGRGHANDTLAAYLTLPDPYNHGIIPFPNIKAIDGVNVLRFSGISNQSDGFFVGGIQHRAGNPGGSSSFVLPESWSDPSQIYFNIYVYGNGKGNTLVNLEFDESDSSNAHNDYSLPKDTLKAACDAPATALNSFDYDPCTDDGWVYPLTVNFTGWRLISVKYSDFPKSVSLKNGGNGNGIKEPKRVARIQMGVVASPAFALTDVCLDYGVISYGAPFDPSK
jgi:hypothetical protein